MPSHLHATLTEMFRHPPQLAAELLRDVSGARGQIEGCADLEQLDTWFDRALDARTVDDLLVDLVVAAEDAGIETAGPHRQTRGAHPARAPPPRDQRALSTPSRH